MMQKHDAKIVILDDDTDVLYTIKQILKPYYTNIITIGNPEQIKNTLEGGNTDLVILDMNFKPGVTSGIEGMEILKFIKTQHPDTSVIVQTAYGDIPLAVEAIKEGASDFLAKPWDREKLIAMTEIAVNLSKSKKEIHVLKDKNQILTRDAEKEYLTIIGESTAMKDVLDIVKKIAHTDVNVLILGENGTGKELIARAIHRASNRSHESFVTIDLGAIPENLFESELFGYEKGAFTDAGSKRMGRVEAANRGTLFLDEIGNLPSSLQVKLLTMIQNREIYRIGGNEPIKTDHRLICATNKPLLAMVDEGEFRQDLLYRIKTVEITVPSLRDRITDIPLLAEHFLHIYKYKYQRPNKFIEKQTMELLQNYTWPGNVRELQFAMERAVILSDNDMISTGDILPERSEQPVPGKAGDLNLETVEKNLIKKALIRASGNYSTAAKLLGMGRTTLYRKLKKHGIG